MTVFLNLLEINKKYHADFSKALDKVIDSGWFIDGPELSAFENDFAEYNNVQACVGVGNGLDAIQMLLQAYGVGLGDEVIVPSNTFIATWLAVTRTGARPIPVEPDACTFNIDPNKIEAAITNRTKAIIAVHLFGQPADMDRINQIASNNNLLVFEDSAQSHGANYKGRRLGCLSNGAATSFYPGKNLGALGDGGAILTNDLTVANKIKELRNYGSHIKYQHDQLGCNSRLDEIQAAFLRIKLKNLDADNCVRAAIAERYSAMLTSAPIETPKVAEFASPAWHLYVIMCDDRNGLQNHLKMEGIQTLIHYPTPPHLQKCYVDDYGSHKYPLAESMAKRMLSLPISPVMTDEEVNGVILSILDYYNVK